MKVLYFHQHFSTPKGSTGTRSYEMAKHLMERGHEVTVVCGSNAMCETGLVGDPVRGLRRGRVEGIDVVEICLPYSNHDGLFKRAWTFVRFAFKSIFIAQRENYDLLFATSTPLTAAIPGIAMRVLKPGKRFVFEVRDLWPELPRAMGMKNPLILGGMSVLEKLSYLAMDGGVALSPGIREGMRRRCRAKTPIELVPNGCDLDLFQPSHAEFDPSRLPEGYPREGLRCVFTGAHGQANGLDAVLDAAKVLLERGRKDIHLIFVGDGKLKPRLLERKKLECLDNCLFFDRLPKDQLNEVMAQTDTGLMILANYPAFYFGTSPNKFFDYIASGLPVLNNYPGWLAELINENACGVTVPPQRADLFGDALEKLADNPSLRVKMGENARNLAEKSFARKLLAGRFVDFLETVVRGAGN
jgi:glycosyltransferase involved in cell wall biosynthesis